MKVGPVTAVTLAQFAGASGDYNPMHLDAGFAVAAGFPSVIGTGVLAAAVAAETMVAKPGDRISIRFRAPYFPGTTLSCEPGETATDWRIVANDVVVASVRRESAKDEDE